MIKTIITNTSYKNSINELKKYFNDLKSTGSFFVIFSNEYDKANNIKYDFLDIIKEAIDIGYNYINTIVYPLKFKNEHAIVDSTKYIIWLAKNYKKVSFLKDKIREKHIWKDVEWGHRDKNYNPKGKDPGNVWIPTEDDGKAHITNHILLDDKNIYDRLLKMTNCGKNYKIIKEKNKIQNTRKYKCNITDNLDKSKSYSNHADIYFSTSEKMVKIKNNSIKTVITSPPYWNLKNYYKDGQIGQENYQQYLKRVTDVWKECYKKLTINGSLWININIRATKGIPILIPYDIKEACKKIGFYYKGIIIWHKSSGIPSNSNNISDHHEYILIFTKDKKHKFDINVQLSFSDYLNTYINGGSFWNINRKAGSVGKKTIHPAIYPNQLVERIVLMSSQIGDTILDPFLGSGTSLIPSLQCGRNFIGYEFNEGFKELMMERFANEIPEKIDCINFFEY